MNDNLPFVPDGHAHAFAYDPNDDPIQHQIDLAFEKIQLEAKLKRRATLRKEVGMNSSKIKQSVRRAKKRR